MEKRAGAEASKSLHDLRSEIHRGDWVVLPPSFAIVFASQPRRAGSTRSGCSIKLAIVSPLSLSGMWWQGKVSSGCPLPGRLAAGEQEAQAAQPQR